MSPGPRSFILSWLRRVQIGLVVLSTFFLPSWSLAQETSPELYLSFEQRVLISLALEMATSEPERQRQLQEKFSSHASELLAPTKAPAKVHLVHVQDWEAFLKEWRGPWPDTHSLSLDLDLLLQQEHPLHRRFTGATPELQAQIDRWIQEQPGRLVKALQASGLQMPSLTGFSSTEARQLLDSQTAHLDELGKTIAERAFQGDQDKALQIAVKTLFAGYYSKLGLESKKQIASAFLGSNLLGNEMSRFEILVQNSGPQLQKMLQVMGRQGDLAPDVAEVFRRLESKVRAVPWVLVEDLLKKEKAAFRFSEFEHKPLGVGTMAQVHAAQLITDKGLREPVVVRFLKPGIEARVDEDHRILSEIAKVLDQDPEFRATGAPRISALVEDITRTVRAELDLEATLRRQQTAARGYNRVLEAQGLRRFQEIEFHVPRIRRAKIPSQLHVQEQVKGQKLDSLFEGYQNREPKLKQAVVEAAARLWIERVLVGDGFYHADLHPGNFLVEARGSRIVVHLLDYGMAGRLGSELRQNLVVLGAAIQINKAELLRDAFWDLSVKAKNQIKKEALLTAITQEVRRIDQGRTEKKDLKAWTAFMMDRGLSLPYDFINMNRGAVILDKMMKEAGSPHDFSSLAVETARKHQWAFAKTFLQGGVNLADLARIGLEDYKRRLFPPPKKAAPRPLAPRCELVFQ